MPLSYGVNHNVLSVAHNDHPQFTANSSSSSDSNGSTFSPTAQTIPVDTSSVSDGGVGHAHQRGTKPRVVPHSQRTIRENTVELSGLMVSSGVTSTSFPSTYRSSNGSQTRSDWTPSTFLLDDLGVFDSTIRTEPRSPVVGGNLRSAELSGYDGNHTPSENKTSLEPSLNDERGRSSGSRHQGFDGPQSSMLEPALDVSDDHSSQFKSGLSLLLHSSPSSPVKSSRSLAPPKPSRESSHSSTRTVTVSHPSEQDSTPEDSLGIGSVSGSGSPTPTSTRVGSPYPKASTLISHPPRPKSMTSADVRRTVSPRKSKIRWDPALDNAIVVTNHHSYDQNGINGGPYSTHENESTPLLGPSPAFQSSSSYYGVIFSRSLKSVTVPKPTQIRQALHDTAIVSLRAIPAVLLGSLLNILDGVSYGMIIFPTSAPFTNLGPMGVSMFFVSCVLAQLCFTFGGSGFAGANGSMMIEVVVGNLFLFRSYVVDR